MRDSRKKISAIIVALIVIMCFFTTNSGAQGSKIIEIYTASDLMKIGNNPDWPLDRHYLLMNDLVFEENSVSNFTMIAPEMNNPFTGIFDGNNHTIKGLTRKAENEAIALFGYVGLYKMKEGVVKNLGLVDISLEGERVATLANSLRNGIIENCYSTGNISGTEMVGGIVATSTGGIIKKCYSICSINGKRLAGGIAAINAGSSTILKCYYKGNIFSQRTDPKMSSICAGGIVGDNYAKLEKSYFHGEIFVNSDNLYPPMLIPRATGGIVGSNYQDGLVENCYSIGKVTGPDILGGIIGENYGEVRKCYSACELYLRYMQGENSIGGIAGSSIGSVRGNVALNPKVHVYYASYGNMGGRIAGDVLGSTQKGVEINANIYSNYAWSGMEINLSTNLRYTETPVGEYLRNGLSKSYEELTDIRAYIELGWSFDGDNPVWEFSGEYKLPKLVGVGGQEDLVSPSHLM